MKTLPLIFALTLGGCSWFSSEAPAPAPEAEEGQPTKGKKGKKAKEAKAAAAEGEAEPAAEKEPRERRPPLLRTARFAIPLNTLSDADVVTVQQAVSTAWNEVAKDEATPPQVDGFPKPWKCRRATVYEVQGNSDGALPALRLFERYAEASCGSAEDKLERWELSLRYELPTRPEKRDGGGEFDYLMTSLDITRAGETWEKTYAHIFRRDSGELEVAFPHDDAWLGQQIPSDIKLTGKSAVVNSERWALGKFTVAGELITVELERWSCRDGAALAGAELVFRTNKREAGHSQSTPKDVLVTDKVNAFGDAIVKALGERVGGSGATTAAALTCAK
jgi:hypothetical protein